MPLRINLRRTAIISAFLLTPLVIALSLYTVVFPYDKVMLSIHGMPENTLAYAVLIKERGRVKPINLYVTKLLSSPIDITEHFGHFIRKERLPGWDAFPVQDVQWVDVDEYAVLTIDSDGHWHIWWIDADRIRVSPVLEYLRRGRTAKIVLGAEGHSQITRSEVMSLLGLDEDDGGP